MDTSSSNLYRELCCCKQLTDSRHPPIEQLLRGRQPRLHVAQSLAAVSPPFATTFSMSKKRWKYFKLSGFATAPESVMFAP